MDNFKHIGTGHQFSPWRSARKPKLEKPGNLSARLRCACIVAFRECLGTFGWYAELGNLASRPPAETTSGLLAELERGCRSNIGFRMNRFLSVSRRERALRHRR